MVAVTKKTHSKLVRLAKRGKVSIRETTDRMIEDAWRRAQSEVALLKASAEVLP
jgi:hypothetical protein